MKRHARPRAVLRMLPRRWHLPQRKRRLEARKIGASVGSGLPLHRTFRVPAQGSFSWMGPLAGLVCGVPSDSHPIETGVPLAEEAGGRGLSNLTVATSGQRKVSATAYIFKDL